jgi:hypothetical protein
MRGGRGKERDVKEKERMKEGRREGGKIMIPREWCVDAG